MKKLFLFALLLFCGGMALNAQVSSNLERVNENIQMVEQAIESGKVQDEAAMQAVLNQLIGERDQILSASNVKESNAVKAGNFANKADLSVISFQDETTGEMVYVWVTEAEMLNIESQVKEAKLQAYVQKHGEPVQGEKLKEDVGLSQSTLNSIYKSIY